MSRPRRHRSPRRRARRSFWVLVGTAVLATGSLSAALTADPSPLTGLRVAGSGIAVFGSLALATRVMLALEQARLNHRRVDRGKR